MKKMNLAEAKSNHDGGGEKKKGSDSRYRSTIQGFPLLSTLKLEKKLKKKDGCCWGCPT